MKYYQSRAYETMYPGQFAKNTFLILDMKDESFRLEEKVRQLEEDIEEAIETGRLKKEITKGGKLASRGSGWNKKDEEALVFLKRMTLWCAYPESEGIDPTQWQINTIVNRMLMKVYGRHYGQFNNWMQIWVDTTKMDSTELRQRMNLKRKIVAQLKEEGLLPKGHPVP